MPDDLSRNSDAFVQLMTEHQGRLYAYVLSLLGDPDQANDVLQEANLVLWRNAGEFQMGSNFRAWAFRIAHFQVMAHRQRQLRDRLVFDDELLAVLDPAAKAVDEIEVDVAAGAKWSLGIALDGDSFEGYRVIFAAPRYPNGIELDSLYPAGQTLLAQDPRPIAAERDHTLRVEKQGSRFRVWVDHELRIDTVVEHPLAEARKRTFAFSNFGESPLIRAVRVWKAAGK